MQRDHLEQFILQERESFDDTQPSLQVWGEIGKALDRQRSRRLRLWRLGRAAAAIIALLACGAVLGGYLSGGQWGPQAVSLAEVAPEYKQVEALYQQQIQQKYQKLASYRNDPSLERDLAQLDKVAEELRRELRVAPRAKEEEIVKSLIQNYQAKVAILERVLDRIQSTSPEINNEETEHGEISI